MFCKVSSCIIFESNCPLRTEKMAMSLNVVIAKSAFPRFSSLVGILCRPMLGGVFPGQVRVRSWVKKVKNQIISNGTFNSIGDINCTFSKNYVWIKKTKESFYSELCTKVRTFATDGAESRRACEYLLQARATGSHLFYIDVLLLKPLRQWMR
jgi:hypothetical protein